ncbi:zinc-dependent dehydrogenase [Atrimonas thermophila]|uniref:zinc-dependent dehydrogenase n=1 Tax=Atrimonas thermophila TaxID=3064161 RepID=UPI00399C9FFA
MRAAVLYGPRDLRIEDVPIPQIGPDEVLLKVAFCAICGTDVRIFNYGHRSITKPQIIGHEVSGTIVEKGTNVEDFEVGDQVVVDPIVSCGKCHYCQRGMTNLCLEFKKTTEAFGYYYPGGFAEYMAIPKKALRRGNLVKVPSGVSLAEAAIAEPFACALNGQMLSKVGLDDTVLVIGAGPVGCMHVGLARSLGATKIILSEVKETRLEIARKFLADVYVNPLKEDLFQVVMRETNGIGVSVIIVAVSSRTLQEEALRFAACRARINFFGGLPKEDNMVVLDSNTIHYKELYIHGTSGTTTNHIRTCLELMNSKRIMGKEYISTVIDLKELPIFLEKEIQEGKYLKVLVKP